MFVLYNNSCLNAIIPVNRSDEECLRFLENIPSLKDLFDDDFDLKNFDKKEPHTAKEWQNYFFITNKVMREINDDTYAKKIQKKSNFGKMEKYGLYKMYFLKFLESVKRKNLLIDNKVVCFKK